MAGSGSATPAPLRAKILEISSYPPPRAGWGVRIEHVKRRLEELGHDCQVLNIGKSRKLKSPEYVDCQSGLDYLRKVIRFSRRGYSLHLHLNGDSPKGFLLALLAGLVQLLILRRRSFLTFHAGAEQRFFPQSRSRLFAPVIRATFALARVIICNSPSVKERIAGYGVPPSRIVPIPAFSRQYLQFRPCPLPPAVEEFYRRRDPVLSSYVFFRPEFFIESLVDAVPRLLRVHPNLGLVILGSDADSEPIRRRIGSLGVQEHVLLGGDQPHDEFMTALQRSRIYIRTPKKDGVCSSVLEALSLGVPVVASENGTRPAGVVTFRPDDAEDLARAVLEVLSEHERVRKAIVPPPVADTVQEEIDVLLGRTPSGAVPS
ncbi:MAG: glycosyltransferase family 4 protein [Thermoanaerobaculia bacterium]